jgi:hypothetical protein
MPLPQNGEAGQRPHLQIHAKWDVRKRGGFDTDDLAPECLLPSLEPIAFAEGVGRKLEYRRIDRCLIHDAPSFQPAPFHNKDFSSYQTEASFPTKPRPDGPS